MREKREHSRFLQASASQCKEFYPSMLQNGERHYQAANVLGKSGDYANGSAHIVLAGEEFLKAVVVFLLSRKFDLTPITDAQKLFYKHEARHDVLKELFAVLEVMVTTKASIQKNIVVGALQFIYAPSRLKAANKWWNDAELLKQKAFYFDYTSVISDPSTITKQEFDSALHRGQGIRTAVIALIEFIIKMEPDDLATFRDRFIDDDTLELINQSIAGNSEWQ